MPNIESTRKSMAAAIAIAAMHSAYWLALHEQGVPAPEATKITIAFVQQVAEAD